MRRRKWRNNVEMLKKKTPITRETRKKLFVLENYTDLKKVAPVLFFVKNKNILEISKAQKLSELFDVYYTKYHLDLLL